MEVSEYQTKVEHVTYSPYKYEVKRTKTQQIRFPPLDFAQLFRAFPRIKLENFST